MSNTKPEIPAAMLDAAVDVLLGEEWDARGYQRRVDVAPELAQVALEAAGVAKLLNEMETIRASITDFQPEAVLARESALMDRAEKAEARIAELEAELRKIVQSKEVIMPIDMDEDIKELLNVESAGGAGE